MEAMKLEIVWCVFNSKHQWPTKSRNCILNTFFPLVHSRNIQINTVKLLFMSYTFLGLRNQAATQRQTLSLREVSAEHLSQPISSVKPPVVHAAPWCTEWLYNRPSDSTTDVVEMKKTENFLSKKGRKRKIYEPCENVQKRQPGANSAQNWRLITLLWYRSVCTFSQGTGWDDDQLCLRRWRWLSH